jgi:hypothetical protein
MLQQPPPPLIRVMMSGGAEYEIELIGHWKLRTDGGKVRFLVQWKDYPKEEITWEPIYHITRFVGQDLWREYVGMVKSNNLYCLIPTK